MVDWVWIDDTDRTLTTIENTLLIYDVRTKLKLALPGRLEVASKFFLDVFFFKIHLYLGGDDQDDHISLYLVNSTDKKVRARLEVLAAGKEGDIPLLEAREDLYSEKRAPLAQRRFGWSQCIPHERCNTGEILHENGDLHIKVRVKITERNIPSSNLEDQLLGLRENMEYQMTGLKHVVRCQQRELNNLRITVTKHETAKKSREGEASVRCPMCNKLVRRPMRLQQCPKGHIICDSCYLKVKTDKKTKKRCITCKTENYCGRPAVLERILGLGI